MNPKTYLLVQRCVEDGVRAGLQRAYKNTESPTPEHICDQIERSVMYELCEWFWFDIGDGDEA